MADFTGKKILITGGTSGIGKRMAIQMAAEGGTVIIWDINTAGLNDVVGEIENAGGKAVGYLCDLSKRNEIYRTAELVLSEHGTIDILINNAGIVAGKKFMDIEDAKIEQTFAVNTMAHFWTVKSFLPPMLEQNSGHIVTIASAGALIGTAGLSDYSASKFAAFGFDESLRFEFQRNGNKIDTTVVCPYYINTGMFEGVKTRFSFLLPILDETKTAKKIVRAIRKKKPRLIMPWFVYTVPPIRILPVKLFDAIVRIFGIHKGMDEFKGHSGK